MTKPFVISGHCVLGEILRRERERENAFDRLIREIASSHRERRVSLWRIGRALKKLQTHTARLSETETVESNLPLP